MWPKQNHSFAIQVLLAVPMRNLHPSHLVRSQPGMHIAGLMRKQNVRSPPALQSLFMRRENPQTFLQQGKTEKLEADQRHDTKVAEQAMDTGAQYDPIDIDNEEASRHNEMVIPTIVLSPPSDDDFDMKEDSEDVDMTGAETDSIRSNH
ncbi:hypothetical protein FOC1_g10002991 [Fusarium oxysporum f. sp. cubense race 1]|uniref:Uncharacterized protein n=1 Tax=Fusarium oxysporum f. sp. cubense (strain race 1) TaxID=1229664 RepID=N4UKX1_FUSC1|nr:hypothetical protein FOC1_g10002991 [Fusarium oxysporum f. sp. cubense race 1]